MVPPPKLITVAGSEHGIALLDFLAKRLSTSNRQAKRLLDDRAVFVNNRRVWMARHVLAAGDRVEVQVQSSRPPPARPPRILFEDSSYLIVDKPAGILSNGPNSAEALLCDALRREVYAVHRLDRDTSGCLLLATSPGAREAMAPLFQEKELIKVYHALVAGSFPRTLHTIRRPIDGQPAVTHVHVVKAAPAASFLEVRLETGRTHQIRKHLAFARHPVLGDKSYATSAIEQKGLRHIPRQMLHASRIEFTSPAGGARIRAQADFPPDFERCRALLQLR
jgi:RluA family pseudouridine synthase